MKNSSIALALGVLSLCQYSFASQKQGLPDFFEFPKSNSDSQLFIQKKNHLKTQKLVPLLDIRNIENPDNNSGDLGTLNWKLDYLLDVTKKKSKLVRPTSEVDPTDLIGQVISLPTPSGFKKFQIRHFILSNVNEKKDTPLSLVNAVREVHTYNKLSNAVSISLKQLEEYKNYQEGLLSTKPTWMIKEENQFNHLKLKTIKKVHKKVISGDIVRVTRFIFEDYKSQDRNSFYSLTLDYYPNYN
jgi:hypothetical protein